MNGYFYLDTVGTSLLCRKTQKCARVETKYPLRSRDQTDLLFALIIGDGTAINRWGEDLSRQPGHSKRGGDVCAILPACVYLYRTISAEPMS